MTPGLHSHVLSPQVQGEFACPAHNLPLPQDLTPITPYAYPLPWVLSLC
jgi:hypothetical protein